MNLYWGLSLYNGDVFFLPCFYRDMVEGHGHWFFWTFSQAKFFFPDMPLYWAFKQFSASYLAPLFWEMLVYGAILGCFSVWFFSTFMGVGRRMAVLCAALHLALFTSPVFNLFGVLQGVIWPAFHAGGFAITLLSIAVLFTALKQRRGFWLLLPLGFLGGFAEPLYLLDFALPAVVVILADRLSWQFKTIGILSVLLVGVGMAAGQFLSPFLLPSFSFVKTASLLDIFSKLWLCLCQTVALSPRKPLALITLLGLAWILWCGRAALRLRWRELIVFGGGALLPFAAAFVTGAYTGTGEWRYFPEVVVFGLMLVIGVFLSKGVRPIAWSIVALSAVLPPLCAAVRSACGERPAMYVASVANVGHDPIVCRSLPAWRDLERPADMRTLEELKSLYHLHDGLAVDWLCRPTNVLSGTGLRLHQINGRGFPRFLLNSAQEYGVAGLSSAVGNHDFIVDYLFDGNKLIEHFGMPKAILTLKLYPGENGDVDLLIYPPGVLDGILQNDPSFFHLVSLRLQKNPYLLDDGAMRLLACRFRGGPLDGHAPR